METKKRKPQYEVGREKALNEVFTLLSMAVDTFPKPISPATVALITDEPDIATRIDEQLKRFRAAVASEVRKTKGLEAVS